MDGIKRERSLRELCLQIADSSIAMWNEFFGFLGFSHQLLRSTSQSLRHPRQLKWRSVCYYMDSCGSDAMPIIALLGFLIGVILAFQAIVQLSRFGVDNFVVNLVGTVIGDRAGRRWSRRSCWPGVPAPPSPPSSGS